MDIIFDNRLRSAMAIERYPIQTTVAGSGHRLIQYLICCDGQTGPTVEGLPLRRFIPPVWPLGRVALCLTQN